MNFKRLVVIVSLSHFIIGAVSIQAQNIVVTPEVYSDALSNPLMGFRPNEHNYDEYQYPTIIHDYITWKEIENTASDGVQKIINYSNTKWAGYEAANIKVIPRVYIDWDSGSGNEYWPSDLTKNDWSSQEFKDRVVNLVYKLGEAWDNDPRVAWVQTGIMGYWGEQENPVGVDEDGWAKRLGEAFTTAFQNKKLVVRNQNHWDAEGYAMGVYWDSFGHPSQESGSWTRIRNANKNGRYLVQPVEGEVAYNWGESSFDPIYGGEPEITLNNYEYTNSMIDVIRELHCSGLGWIASYDLDGSHGSNPDSVEANAARMQKEFGYRFVIPEFSLSRSTNQGDTLQVNFKVKNTGAAPMYENWPVAFVLVDDSSHQIVWTEILPGIDITTWHPGDDYDYNTKEYSTPALEYEFKKSVIVPDSINTGQYMAGITILEPYSRTPGVFFAVNSFLKESQTQPLCRIGIGEDLQDSELIDPAIFSDPVNDDQRSYSLTPQDSIFTLTTSTTDGGSISPSGGNFHSGSTVTLRAIPAPGYEFTGWGGTLSDTTNLVTLFMDSEKNITASFAALPGEAVPWVEDFNFADGTTSDSAATSWLATRATGFFEVRGNRLMINDAGSEGVFTTSNIDISAGSVNISLDVEGVGGLDPSDYFRIFKVVDGVEELMYDHSGPRSSTTITDPDIITTGNTLSLIIKTYTTFNDEYYYFDNLSVTPNTTIVHNLTTSATNGSITLNPSARNYAEGTEVTLTANPYSGFEFSQWSGDLAGNTNPETIIMDGDKSIAAEFSSTVSVPETNLSPKTSLSQNYPNPFGTSTSIPYQLSGASHVKLSMYNILGEHVATLVNKYQDAGYYTVDWKVTDLGSKKVSGAIYIYRLETDNHVYTRKLIIK